jgi:hypothetical protein
MTELAPAPIVAERLPPTAARFLDVVPFRMREDVRRLLLSPSEGGRGLRQWVSMMEIEPRRLPRQLPIDLVEVYLNDDDAEPLHDCEACGFIVPVRVAHRVGHEPTIVREYFPTCPNCGGRTGQFAFWSART